MKWIRTDERMPRPKGGLSLTTRLAFITVDEKAHMGIYDILHDQWWGDRCPECHESYVWDTCDVTHWLPLPAKPAIPHNGDGGR